MNEPDTHGARMDLNTGMFHAELPYKIDGCEFIHNPVAHVIGAPLTETQFQQAYPRRLPPLFTVETRVKELGVEWNAEIDYTATCRDDVWVERVTLDGKRVDVGALSEDTMEIIYAACDRGIK